MPATHDNRPVKLTSPLGKDVLLFKQLSGSERLSQPFQFDVSLLSEKGDIEANDLLGRPVSIAFERVTGDAERVFHGLVSDFTQLSYGERHHEYRLTLRPWFWFLTRTADCQVFQDKTVKEIFEAVAKDSGFSDFRFDLKGTYKKLAYCVQYRETAFNFLSRLLELEGIYYFFEHTAQKHTMVLVDDSGSHKTVEGYAKVPYFPPTAENVGRERDHLSAWTYVKSVQTGAYATTDYDFTKSAASLLKDHAIKRSHAIADFEIFDYPAELPGTKVGVDGPLDDSVTERFVKNRIEAMQASHAVAHGKGNAEGLAVGAQFELTDYPRSDLNGKYLVVAAQYSLTSNEYETSDAADAEFHVAIEAIDLKTQYRAPRITPKPVVQGAQTATVVGKKGEEIDTDEHGRVKVQFHWDRKGQKDEKSSCFVRVAQVWAGQQWGAIHIPRIGQEVIVSFLEGDPDRPIITGRVYNGQQKPPYTLPANATQSGIKSRSSKQGDAKTFNEIRFEDKKGSEELFMHAEKDMKVDVENDAFWRVGLEEDSPSTSKGNVKMEFGKTLDAKVGKTIKIDAGDEITIVTGQSKIVMKKDGEIKITCKKLLVEAMELIDLKSQKDIKAAATMNIDMEGKVKFSAKGLQMALEGTTAATLKSNVSTKVEGTAMLDLSSGGIASLKGSLTKIG
jgi:type VI secretion system secreted protein VgrG